MESLNPFPFLFSFEIFVNSTTITLNGGATADLFYRRTDLILNTRPPSPTYNVEYLYPHYLNPVMIFLPKAKTISGFSNILKVFQTIPQIGIILSLIVAMVFNWIMYKMVRTAAGTRSLLDAGMEIYSYFLLMSYKPTTSYSISHRIFLLSWSILAIVVMSLVTGSLFSQLVVVSYQPDIDAIDTLMKSSYKIPTTKERYSMFVWYTENKDSGLTKMNDQYYRLYPLLEVVGSQKDIFDIIERNDQEHAFMITRGFCEYFVAKKRFANRGKPFYHLMKDTVSK